MYFQLARHWRPGVPHVEIVFLSDAQESFVLCMDEWLTIVDWLYLTNIFPNT